VIYACGLRVCLQPRCTAQAPLGYTWLAATAKDSGLRVGCHNLFASGVGPGRG
jgi:hypothetical protein